MMLSWRLSLSALLLVGCSPAPSADSGNAAALADTLTGMIEQAYDFGRPGAVERMTALYAPDDSLVSASDGHITLSADSVRKGIDVFWQSAGRNMRNARWTWREVHVQRLAPDAAVLTGTWSIPHLTPDGQEHVIEGAWTAVFRRMSGRWRIVHEHLSSPP